MPELIAHVKIDKLSSSLESILFSSVSAIKTVHTLLIKEKETVGVWRSAPVCALMLYHYHYQCNIYKQLINIIGDEYINENPMYDVKNLILEVEAFSKGDGDD